METRKHKKHKQIKLLRLPIEVLTLIGQFFLRDSLKDAAHFYGTSKMLAEVMKTAYEIEISNKFPKLYEHIENRNFDELKAILDINHNLLHFGLRPYFTDRAGRQIKGTIFQYALGAGDIELLKILEPYFNKLRNGNEVKAKQYYQQFPSTYRNQKLDYIFGIMINVINEDPLTNDKENDRTCNELEKFRKFVDEDLTVTIGEHFSLAIYISALQFYHDYFNDFITDEHRLIYFRQVICYLQQLLTSYDATSLISTFTTETSDKTEIATDYKNAIELLRNKDLYMSQLKIRIENVTLNIGKDNNEVSDSSLEDDLTTQLENSKNTRCRIS